MVKDAYRFALPPLIAGIICIFLHWNWLAALLISLSLFVFYFFRDPNRTIPSDPSVVVSPADGHIVEVANEALESAAGKRITIFLAVWDVHVQRAPAAGSIISVEYRPGKFLAAFRARVSE